MKTMRIKSLLRGSIKISIAENGPPLFVMSYKITAPYGACLEDKGLFDERSWSIYKKNMQNDGYSIMLLKAGMEDSSWMIRWYLKETTKESKNELRSVYRRREEPTPVSSSSVPIPASTG